MAVIEFDIVGGALYWMLTSSEEVFVEPADPGSATNDEYYVERVCTCAASTSATPADASNYAFATVAPWTLHQLRNPTDGTNPTSDSATYSEGPTGIPLGAGNPVFTGSWQEVKDRFDAGDISKGFISATVIYAEGTLDFDVTTTGSYVENITHAPVAPQVTDVSPRYGPPTGGISVTITGKYFDSSAVVKFGSTTAASVTVVNSTTLTAVTPVHELGTYDISVTVTGSDDVDRTTTLSNYFSFLTLAILFGGVPATDVEVLISGDTGNPIQLTVPAHAAGLTDVEIIWNGDTYAIEEDIFTYIAGLADLTLTPSAGPTLGGTAITITGEDLIDESTVTFGGVPATSVVWVNSTTITCVSPAHALGDVEVLVIAPDTSTKSGSYSYVELGVSPNLGDTFGGLTVTLTGTGFTGSSTVTIDDAPAFNVNYVDPTHITIETQGHNPGPVEIVVTTGAETLTGTFTYYIFPHFTPPGGPPEGGTLISIVRWLWDEGDNSEFVPGAIITFDGIPATDVTFVDINNYTCKTPPHAKGAVDVVISNISVLGLAMFYDDHYAYGQLRKSPFINAGPDKRAVGPLPSTVFLLATTDAVDCTFLWEQTGGPYAATISTPTSLATSVTFNQYIPGVYSFRIKAIFEDMPYIQDSMAIIISVVRIPIVQIKGVTT